MGRVLASLERLEREVYPRHRHPVLGPASVDASVVRGGQGLSPSPDRCRLEVERRPLPTETPDDIAAEMEALLAGLRHADPSFEASWSLTLFRPGLEVPPEAPVVRAVCRAAAAVLGREPALVGEYPWLDSALLATAGIPTVIFGPAGAGAPAAAGGGDLASVAATAGGLAGASAAGGE